MMNRTEAKLAIESGKKVTHQFFTPEEWVSYYENHVYIFEDGVMVHEVLFWADRQDIFFNDGWEIWQDPTVIINSQLNTNKMAEEKKQTWADLKAAINNLADDQLNKPLILWGAESADTLEFDVLDQDYLFDGEEGCAPKKELEDSIDEPLDLENHYLVHAKGTIILMTGKYLQDVDLPELEK